MRKLIVVLISIAGLLWIASLLTGYTQVLYLSSDKDKKTGIPKPYAKGDTISILEDINFSQGSWCAYIIINKNDAPHLIHELRKANCYKTSNIRLLKEMQTKWTMLITGGDMSTVESRFILFKNGKVEFECGIVLDEETEGLQSRNFGWAEPVNKHALTDCCKRFTRVYSPIIIF